MVEISLRILTTFLQYTIKKILRKKMASNTDKIGLSTLYSEVPAHLHHDTYSSKLEQK